MFLESKSPNTKAEALGCRFFFLKGLGFRL